jgi:hypothetical protein
MLLRVRQRTSVARLQQGCGHGMAGAFRGRGPTVDECLASRFSHSLALQAEIDEGAWASLHRTRSRPLSIRRRSGRSP